MALLPLDLSESKKSDELLELIGLIKQMREEGYANLRVLADKSVVGTMPTAFGHGVYVNLTRYGNGGYVNYATAKQAADFANYMVAANDYPAAGWLSDKRGCRPGGEHPVGAVDTGSALEELLHG